MPSNYLTLLKRLKTFIRRFISQISEDEFLSDELCQSGVLQKLIVIGEAAARLPKIFQTDHADINPFDIIGFRNIAVHEYLPVMWEIVWETAITDVPMLRIDFRDLGK